MKIKIIDNISYQTSPITADMIEFDDNLLRQIGITKQFKNNQIIDYINIDNLRAERKTECFSIVNRGKLWYDSLTEEQLQELKVWYQAWLDVTETLQVPEQPKWLDTRTDM